MDQPHLFPTPATEPPAENYRPTAVYRVPNANDLADAYPVDGLADGHAGARKNRISFGRLMFHLFLFGLTVVTTTFAGGTFIAQKLTLAEILSSLPEILSTGAIFSFTVLAILTAHEMGHYIACRWYGVEATLPYFIPMPFPPVGTFGAFIKMRSPILTRRALFDIGIAGPIAGYIFAIPAAFVGHYFAEPALISSEEGVGMMIHDPLLFKFFQSILHTSSLVVLNPVLWAAWIGVFMTSLNLLPVGQLDGGHVAYAIFGRRGHRVIGMASYLCVIGLALYSIRAQTWNYVVYAVLLTVVMRFGHPPVVDETEPIGLARKLVAVIGLLIFILSFLPVPISF